MLEIVVVSKNTPCAVLISSVSANVLTLSTAGIRSCPIDVVLILLQLQLIIAKKKTAETNKLKENLCTKTAYLMFRIVMDDYLARSEYNCK